MNFSLRLKELRDKKNISQAELAKTIGVSIGCVGMWESTKQIPPASRLEQLANYFNVTVDYILGREELTPEEISAGATDKIKISLSADEYEMLMVYREIGDRFGKQAQRDYTTVGENMLKLK